LICKRAIYFFGYHDRSMLRNGLTPSSDSWNIVGTDEEDPDIPLSDYMSYDEMLISALVGVSCQTFFH